MQSPSASQPVGLSDAVRRTPSNLAPVGIDDKYSANGDKIYLSRIQALVRLLARNAVAHLTPRAA